MKSKCYVVDVLAGVDVPFHRGRLWVDATTEQGVAKAAIKKAHRDGRIETYHTVTATKLVACFN